jgi:pectate lyase
VNNPHQFNNQNDQNSAHITTRDNVYDNTSGTNDPPQGGGTPFTDPPYTAMIDPAEDVPALVQDCAGPQ